MNTDYKAIQKYIDEAKLQRSVYLAELVATAIIAGIELGRIASNYVVIAAKSVFKGAATRVDRSKNVFTFDA